MYSELKNNIRFLIELEKEHQKDIGFDGYHDDMHTRGELAFAAAYFVVPGPVPLGPLQMDPVCLLPENFRDSPKINRSTSLNDACALRNGEQLNDYIERRIRDMVKGIACAMAECERLQRQAGVADPESLPSGV